MQLIVDISDNGNNDLVEAAFDQFYILDSTNSGVNDIANQVSVCVYPNPCSEFCKLLITNQSDLQGHDLTLIVYDLIGREIKTAITPNSDGFEIRRKNLIPGMYFYKLSDGTKLVSTGKLLIE